MTCIKFLSCKDKLCGFEIIGHSTESCDDSEGKLVCSAVSSAAYMAANTIIEIIKADHSAQVDEGKMIFKVNCPSSESTAVLEGFRLHINELSKQYSKRIKIITEV